MTTLAILKRDVTTWLTNNSITGDVTIETVVRLAEADVNRDTFTVAQEAATVLSVPATERSILAPPRFKAVRWIRLTDTAYPNEAKLEYQTPEVLRTQSTYESRSARRTGYYTIEGDGSNNVQFTFAPGAGDQNPLNVDLGYFTGWEPLVNDVDTNWLLQNNYDVFFYAMLRAAAESIQEDNLEDRFATKYERALDRMHLAEQRKRQRMGDMKSYRSKGAP